MLESSTISEYFQNIKYDYIGQAIWGICLALILWYFFELYKRKHLRYWAFSWLAFSGFLVFALLSIYIVSRPETAPFWQSLSTFLFLIFSFVQVYWLLYGTIHLIDKTKLRARQEFGIYALIIVVSLLGSLVYLFENGNQVYNLVIPLAMKTLAVGFSFILAGIKIMRHGKRDPAMGKKILWIAFILYGFQNLQYTVGCISILFDVHYIIEIDRSLGMIEFLLLSFIGIGMIIWLLEEERSALEKTNRELDSFLYSTSHDLRAPVASLLGLINIAKHDIKEPAGQQYVKMMGERVKKLDDIFSDILNYSRNIKTEIVPKTFRLGEMVEDVISDVKFNQGADSIRLDYEEQIHHLVHTDYYQLKVVMANLISNAVKYHDSRKADQYIAIRFEKIDRDVHISVEDNGIGIAPESQHKVFDMFYRATSEAEGSGLGLFIVQQALHKINARITLASELGKGSTFKVIIDNAAVKLDEN